MSTPLFSIPDWAPPEDPHLENARLKLALKNAELAAAKLEVNLTEQLLQANNQLIQRTEQLIALQEMTVTHNEIIEAIQTYTPHMARTEVWEIMNAATEALTEAEQREPTEATEAE